MTDSAPLQKILDDYNANALTQMASFMGVLPEKQRTKAAVSAVILKRIHDPNYLRTLQDNFSPVERALVDAVMRRGGQASVRSLRNELARLELIDPQARVEFGEYSRINRPEPNARNSRRLEDALARLMLRGVLFTTEALVTGYGYQNKRTFYDRVDDVFIPDHIRPYLPEPQPRPRRKYKLSIKEVQEGSARLFQRDLYLYWSYMRGHQVALTQRGEITKAALKEINGILQVREEIKTGETENSHPRMRFLRGILEALGLLRETRQGAVEAAGAEEFFAKDPAERVKQTYTAWRDTARFSEIMILPGDVRPKATSTPLIPTQPALIRARAFVLDQVEKAVKEFSGDDWVPLQGVVDDIYDINYEFLFKRRVTPGYYSYPINPYEFSGNDLYITFPGIYLEQEGWGKVEANLIRAMVIGPLFWMGLVDLGLEKPDQAAAFRLTPMGTWLLGYGPQPEVASQGGRVIVQPNMQITALDPIQDSVLATLDRFAERLSAERAVEYRLTRAAVYSTQQAGWDAARIKDTLQNFSGAELPGNVARTLDEWQAQYERITIRTHVVIAHGEPAAIDRLAQNKQTSGLLAGRPHPEVALLKTMGAANKLVAALYGQNILPVVNAQQALPANSISAAENGELRFTTRFPNLYLHGHLTAFADPAEDGSGVGYRITRASVQRAVRSGISADEIVTRLEAVHSGPLPSRLALKIRAMAGHYGSAGLERLTLVQMQDEKTLEELLADPEIRPLLRRFTPRKTRALARVKPEHVDKLKALLEERGVSLKDEIE